MYKKTVPAISVIAFVLALGVGGAQLHAADQNAEPKGPPAGAADVGAGVSGNADIKGKAQGAAPGASIEAGPKAGLNLEGKARAGKGPAAGGAVGTDAELNADIDGNAGIDGDAGAKGKTGAQAESEMKAPGKAGPTAAGEAEMETEGQAGATGEAKGMTQGDAEQKAGAQTKSKNVRLESQQVSKVKTYFSQHKPTVKSVERTEISISIGVAVPSDIVLYDLPPDVIIVSGACPIEYFVWGDDIVLVDSCSRQVVEIIVGIA